MLGKIQRFLIKAGSRQDLIMMAIVVTCVAMMSFPMPDFLLDLILAITMAMCLAIFITSFYVKSPAELTTFPSFLLVTTLMRLGATVASTRMILLYGEAGDIIVVFGEFIIGGNLLVGIIIFFIILIVNFMVITKGSERVAEVSARFTLDAMPGKQMSIDAELKSGDIDKEEATRRREILGIESQFYGAMDGAMKFVKGDAVASLIVLAVNILGGLAVGPMYMGLTIGESLHKFTILSIGDAMVGQIPGTLISIAAGLVITRISHNKMTDLGADLIDETFQNENTNRILGLLLLGTGLIPGFPWYWFFLLGGIFLLFGFKTSLTELYHIKILKQKDFVFLAPGKDDGAEEKIPAGAAKIEIFFSETLFKTLNPEKLMREIRIRRKNLMREFGINIPPISNIQKRSRMREYFFTMNIDGIPVAESEIAVDKLLVQADHEILQVADIPHSLAAPILGHQKRFNVPIELEEKVKSVGVTYFTPDRAIIEKIEECMRNNLAQFMSVQEVQEWTNDAARTFPDLVNEVRQAMQPTKLTDVFKRLLSDHISLSARRPLLEAMANWAGREEDPAMLAELIRVSLRRQICFSCSNERKIIVAAIFDPSVEEVIRQSVRRTNLGDFLALEPAMSEKVMEHISLITREPRFMTAPPVILCSIDIRRFVRGFLLKQGVDIPVLSHQDIAEDFTVQVIYAIK